MGPHRNLPLLSGLGGHTAELSDGAFSDFHFGSLRELRLFLRVATSDPASHQAGDCEGGTRGPPNLGRCGPGLPLKCLSPSECVPTLPSLSGQSQEPTAMLVRCGVSLLFSGGGSQRGKGLGLKTESLRGTHQFRRGRSPRSCRGIKVRALGEA